MYGIIKRTADFLLSLLGLLVLLPLFILIIVLLKLTGDHEVFFFQERIGLNRRSFLMCKFATMIKNSSSIGNKTVTVRNDPRVTKVGRALRFTKFNELPQLFNVIKGEMSLVGPRPLPPASFEKYTQEIQSIIVQNRPGVTGLGSLVFRDEEKLVSEYRNLGKDPLEYYRENIYPYKGALEAWYIAHKSVLTDCKILILTFWSLIHIKSDMVYSWFQDIPARPYELTMEGLDAMR
ncbi:MAG: sugar transferase [Nitrosomonas ureae]